VLEQQQPDHEAGRDAGPAVLAVERRDLVQPGPKQIARSCRPVLFGRIATSDATKESCLAIRRNLENENCKVPTPEASKPCDSKTLRNDKCDSSSIA
jgi:hypothetical protein